jgi:hypothetical protein
MGVAHMTQVPVAGLGAERSFLPALPLYLVLIRWGRSEGEFVLIATADGPAVPLYTDARAALDHAANEEQPSATTYCITSAAELGRILLAAGEHTEAAHAAVNYHPEGTSPATRGVVPISSVLDSLRAAG